MVRWPELALNRLSSLLGLDTKTDGRKSSHACGLAQPGPMAAYGMLSSDMR
jgi:hypothetical protein